MTRTSGPSQYVRFKYWIPPYLLQKTQASLRVLMEKKGASSDSDGYIYTFEIREPREKNIIKLKIGRTANVAKRLSEWDRQCHSQEHVLRGCYPDSGEEEAGLMRGSLKPGATVPWCHRLEKLVHTELDDLASTGAYLNHGWGAMPAPADDLDRSNDGLREDWLDPMSASLEVPPPHNSCAIMAQFPVPQLYKSRTPRGNAMNYIVFGFPLCRNYLLDFADSHNLLVNEQNPNRRRFNVYMHLAWTIRKRFDAECVHLSENDDGSGDNASFCVAITSNRTQRHLNRMQTYPHFEKLAEFLRLSPEAAEWMLPDRADAKDLIRNGYKVI
ncbi:unnamed protein product [Cyclocybe aegerita]|uniref:Uncharacterized protein n=1 Tax=Cyclocybe aegerita TaxID=1973307 RepID=A0A8S0VVU5_CYCAE|nr:unnamed protein product [Cyclocybe aegerita]